MSLPFTRTSNDMGVLLYADVSEKHELANRDRRLRTGLAHVARLNTAGEMASVLAHEINQPLTAISHNCDSLLSTDFDDREELKEVLQDIYVQSQRAGGIIHSMRQMMRKENPTAARVDINRLGYRNNQTNRAGGTRESR